MWKKNIENLKKMWADEKEMNKRIVYKKSFKNIGHTSNVFGKYFFLCLTDDNRVFVDNKHEVKILAYGTQKEVIYEKSTGKKLAAATVLGLTTGGVGALVGAVAFGNNKKSTETNFYIKFKINDMEETVTVKNELGLGLSLNSFTKEDVL